MDGELERADLGRLRISHAERERVAELLRVAAGDGRIDLAELDDRLEATYAAKTYADLVPITHDLPGDDLPGHDLRGQRAAATPAVLAGEDRQRHFAVLSGLDRSGVWQVPERLSILCLLGGATLDLRQATYAAPEVVITVNAVMGGASIIVDPHTRVVLEGTGIMGGYSGPSGLTAAEVDDTSPTVRIRGIAVWGGVTVERKPAKR